jgi:hypothetical protein
MSLHVGFSLCRQLVTVKDLKWADVLMMSCMVVFAGVVGSIENTFSPKIFELVLRIAAF